MASASESSVADTLSTTSFAEAKLQYERGAREELGSANAMRLTQSAAALGYAPAQYSMGRAYMKNRNKPEALAWFRKAADQGHPAALTKLAVHEPGSAVMKKVSGSYFDQAAAKGDLAAQLFLGFFHHNLSRAHQEAKESGESEAAQTASARYLALASAQGSREATTALGMFHERGLGVAKDEARALELYRMAAEKHHVVASFLINNMERLGRGLDLGSRFMQMSPDGVWYELLVRVMASIHENAVDLVRNY